MQTRFLSAAVLPVLTFGLACTLPAAPVSAQGRRLSEPAGGFSYLPPAGWHIRTFPGLKYKICYTAPANGFAPNINTVDEVTPMAMGPYVQLSVAHMKLAYTSLHILSQKPFATASGVQGVRMMTDGLVGDKHVHQVFYVFPGASSRKYVLTASSLASDHGKYDAATDQAMKTFKLQ